MIKGAIFIELDFGWGFQKYTILEVFNEKLLLGTLEDVIHPLEVPDGDHDGLSNLY